MGDSIDLQNDILWDDTPNLLKWLKDQIVLNWSEMFKVEVGRKWTRTMTEQLRWVPNNIRDIAQEKLKNKYATEAWKEYRNLKWLKPDFFPFLCTYIWYKNIWAKSKILGLVDYSKWGSGYGLLYMMDMRSHNVLLQTTAVKWKGGFSNVPDSHKLSLWFAQVCSWIRTDGSTGPHVLLNWLEQWFNDNMKARKMYLHGWTKSEWCIVVPVNQRSMVLNTVANSDTIMLQYYPDANYLKNSRKLI